MDFTDEERRAWHEARRRGNDDSDEATGDPATACLHCGAAVTSGNGVVAVDAAICDVCND